MTRTPFQKNVSAHSLAACAGAVLTAATFASAQTAPLASHEVPWQSDSGFVAQPTKAAAATVVYSTTVFVPRAPWLRLSFDAVTLAGRVEEGRGSFLRITSLLDGGVQYLNSVSAAQWANTSCYFNGDAVRVELLAYPGAGTNRLAIRSVTVGEAIVGGVDSICGPTDDRVLSSDPRASRHLPEGCSTWLFNDTSRTFLTAGHCGVTAGDVQQFNVPLSTGSGGLVNPPPEDQYPVDSTSIQATSGIVGADYAYFACFPNSNTGMTAFQKQNAFYNLAPSVPAVSGQSIRIIGYGSTDGALAPLTWYLVQKTHSGPYSSFSGTTIRYQVDTTGGNSGSAVENLANNTVIGIHTHAGCSNPMGTSSNQGTALSFGQLQTALANPLTNCKTGKGVVTPPLYAIGDGQNNFGTLNIATGNFARIKDGPVRMEGLAFNRNTGLFYGINNDTNPAALAKRLYTIDPATGNATLLGSVTGTGAASPINGLGFDDTTNTLYGINQATGQLVTINTATRVATTIGPANPSLIIGALEFRHADGLLYGIDDNAGGSRLVRWSSPTAAATIVGPLGAGATDCNGLAVTDSGELWTINAANEQLLRVNATTGAATVIGSTGGTFGASFGMSATLAPIVPACYADCDGVGGLTGNDFQCFMNAFLMGQGYANCDGVAGLTANDFQCFLDKFVAGCS